MANAKSVGTAPPGAGQSLIESQAKLRLRARQKQLASKNATAGKMR